MCLQLRKRIKMNLLCFPICESTSCIRPVEYRVHPHEIMVNWLPLPTAQRKNGQPLADTRRFSSHTELNTAMCVQSQQLYVSFTLAHSLVDSFSIIMFIGIIFRERKQGNELLQGWLTLGISIEFHGERGGPRF